MGLITETNSQYYSGQQTFPNITNVSNPTFTCTFNTKVISAFNNAGTQVGSASNYTIYINGVAQTESLSYVSDSLNNVITLRNGPYTSTSLYIQLKQQAIDENYGSYEYVSLTNIVNNFMLIYVGIDKLIPRISRNDVIFHAKRGLQEFSYDTLNSVKSQELTIPPSLSVVIPQDYVNYVKMSWIDNMGIKRPIYPANNLTINPYSTPLQDDLGTPTQDNFGENTEGTSITEERWSKANDNLINGRDIIDDSAFAFDAYGRFDGIDRSLGQQYGIDPQYANMNGWFTINHREGKFSFSNDLVDKLIVLEYISDGLAYDLETKIPKMAEEAIYAHISHAIIASRINQPEYIVRRLKQERSSKLRNAKIRLSNIKLDEIVQTMRGKSKWIKH